MNKLKELEADQAAINRVTETMEDDSFNQSVLELAVEAAETYVNKDVAKELRTAYAKMAEIFQIAENLIAIDARAYLKAYNKALK